jgi:hypothetical protein
MTASSSREPETQAFDDASWLLIALCLFLVIGFQLVEPFAFAPVAIVKPAATIGLLWIGARFYTRYRFRPGFAALLTSIMQIILFSLLGAALSYMVAAQGGALWDARFQRWDAMMGFDWLAYVRWVDGHPALATLYRWAYVTLIPQMVVLVMSLTIVGKMREMRVVVCAAILAGAVTVLASGWTPAVSNYVHLNLSLEEFRNLRPAAALVHYADFAGLRDGSLRLIDLDAMEGIITFPSYHAALGAIFIWGFLRVGRAGWAGAAWAALMLLATPVDGAHYFVDVFAGIAVAAMALVAAERLVRRPWFRLAANALGGKASLPGRSALPI